MNKIWFSLIALLAFCAPAFGQSFIQNTMYDFNRFVYNPATAGLADQGRNQGWSINTLGRLQWAGIDGSPQVASLAAHRYYKDFGSVGGYIMQDELGSLSSTSINLSYALPIEVGTGHLSFGVSGGYSQRAINQQVFAIQGGDPIIPNPGEFLTGSTGAFNLSAGVFYQARKEGKERFFIGLSGQDLLEPSLEALTIAPGVGGISNVPRSFYLTSGYRIPIGFWAGDNYNYLQPTMMLRTQGGVIQSDLTVLARVSAMRVGVNYRGVWFTGQANTNAGTQVNRGSESVGGILGFDVNDELFFGYSYDFNLSSLNANGDASSHELVLTFRINTEDKPRLIGDPIKDSRNGPKFVSPAAGAQGATPGSKVEFGTEGKKKKGKKSKKAKEPKEGKEKKAKGEKKVKGEKKDKAAAKAEKEAEKAKKKDEKAKKKAKKQYKAKKKKASKKK